MIFTSQPVSKCALVLSGFARASFVLAVLLPFLCLGSAEAQENSKPGSLNASRFPSFKKQPASAGNKGGANEAFKFGADKNGPDQIRKRDEWFYKQRSSVNGHIPAGSRLQALEHMHRRMVAEGKLVLRPDGTYAAAPLAPAGAPLWNPIGPAPATGGFFSPVTGRVTTIAVDPTDTTGNTVLIGGAQGGIRRTTDAGSTWAPVGDQDASLAMGSIAFAPSQPATVYAGTGEQAALGFDVYYGAGVLKSLDGGKTWAQTCTIPSSTCPFIGPFSDGIFPGFGFLNFGGARISYVSVNPANPQMVLVGAQFFLQGPNEGVYCSDDGGVTWSNVQPGQMSTFVGFASSSVAYAALGIRSEARRGLLTGFTKPRGSAPLAPPSFSHL